MNNKGFAITGIIYTLFILFLMILLSVLSGLSSFHRLMINSVESMDDSFKGKEISSEKLEKIKTTGIATYSGKYIFNLSSSNLECSAYLSSGTNLAKETITLFPNSCGTYNSSSMELINVYSFEAEE